MTRCGKSPQSMTEHHTDRKRRVKRACGKRRFRDKGEAIKSLHRIRTGGTLAPKIPCRVYYCEWCHGYHLTSQR
jgi:hypothetical protein